MKPAPASPEPADPGGRWIPWTFVGLFAVMLVANGCLVYFAFGSFTGLSTKQPYRQGLGFNAALDANARQEALGLEPVLTLTPDAGGALRVSFEVRSRSGEALRTSPPEIAFRRPTAEGHDFSITLTDAGEGRFTGRATPPLRGLWDLHIRVRNDRRTYKWIRRVRVP